MEKLDKDYNPFPEFAEEKRLDFSKPFRLFQPHGIRFSSDDELRRLTENPEFKKQETEPVELYVQKVHTLEKSA